MEERGRFVRHAIDNSVDRLDVESAMRRAIDLASTAYPHPNPRVGAVILTPDGHVRSSGFHRSPGGHHAEVAAIAGGVEPGDTLVVTLEPCNHQGRTPPCTQAILDAGIERVVVGALDPDTRVRGQGVDRLREAGLEVHVGLLAPEVEAADPGYFHHRRTGRARVTLKLATTLDGQVAAADGSSRWITSPEARTDAHRLRSLSDAVLVGMGTVIADDPSLTVRLDDYDGPQPRAVVLAGTRTLPATSAIAGRDPIVYRSSATVDIDEVVRDLPLHGVLSVLVEGGPRVAAAFLEARLVDEVVWYVGAKLGGGVGIPAIAGTFTSVSDAITLSVTDVTMIGPDVRITGHVADE
jgi:diaminohydroxyphosphoribosylaminopyrimidine deaminase / 5-amino-6-(5-phosphoribosylamino)uracil reductase